MSSYSEILPVARAIVAAAIASGRIQPAKAAPNPQRKRPRHPELAGLSRSDYVRTLQRRKHDERRAAGLTGRGTPRKMRPYTCDKCGSPGWTRRPLPANPGVDQCLGCIKGTGLSKHLAAISSCSPNHPSH